MPPEQLDWCSACNAPIYLDRSAGGCTCREGNLRALQILVERNQAAREKRVAVGTPRHTEDLGSILLAEARRELGLEVEAAQLAREVHAGLDVPTRPVHETRSLNLEELWTQELEGDFPEPNANGDAFAITFDSVGDIEFDELPQRVGSEATRFRVDRGAPQRDPFRPNIEAGPQGGPMREVGSVRGFQVLREQRLRGEVYVASEPEYVGVIPPRTELRVLPKPPEKPIHRPTVYERLDKGFLDDD